MVQRSLQRESLQRERDSGDNLVTPILIYFKIEFISVMQR